MSKNNNEIIKYIEFVKKRKDIKKLSHDEEIELFKRYNDTNITNKEKLEIRQIIFENNYDVVIEYIYKKKIKSKIHDEAIQEGNIGILKAIDKFDYTRGIRFSTVAYYYVNAEILNYISKFSNKFTIPRNIANEVYNLRKENDIRLVEGKELLTKAETYNILKEKNLGKNLEGETIYEYLNKMIVSSDIEINLENGEKKITISEILISKKDENNELIDKILKEQLYERIKEVLSEEEYELLNKRFGIGNNSNKQTYNELAKENNITIEGVRKRMKKILTKLKRVPEVQNLLEEIINNKGENSNV